MWRLKKDSVIFLRRLSCMLVPLQAITDCFLRDFVCPPGRVMWLPSTEAWGRALLKLDRMGGELLYTHRIAPGLLQFS